MLHAAIKTVQNNSVSHSKYSSRTSLNALLQKLHHKICLYKCYNLNMNKIFGASLLIIPLFCFIA